MMNLVLVGLGGAIGSVLRYIISLIPIKHVFPFPTLITNICGAVLIGYITGLCVKKGFSPQLILFLKTGLCGGFTTFSTFSLEAYTLFQNGFYGYAVLYVILSLAGTLFGVWLGMELA